jgi:hypothetical protein
VKHPVLFAHRLRVTIGAIRHESRPKTLSARGQEKGAAHVL